MTRTAAKIREQLRAARHAYEERNREARAATARGRYAAKRGKPPAEPENEDYMRGWGAVARNSGTSEPPTTAHG